MGSNRKIELPGLYFMSFIVKECLQKMKMKNKNQEIQVFLLGLIAITDFVSNRLESSQCDVQDANMIMVGST